MAQQKVGFMEKLGNEPGTPGLQGIGLSPTPRQTEYKTYV